MSTTKSINANLYNINILTKINTSNIYDEEKSLFYQSLIDTQPLYEGFDFFLLTNKFLWNILYRHTIIFNRF